MQYISVDTVYKSGGFFASKLKVKKEVSNHSLDPRMVCSSIRLLSKTHSL